MTLSELRNYLADPAKDDNPAIQAARAAVRERDDAVDRLSKLVNERLAHGLLERRVKDLEADREAMLKEVSRLRGEVSELTPAPWETTK